MGGGGVLRRVRDLVHVRDAFSIGSLCLWCTGIVTAVLAICAALTRIVHRAEAFGSGQLARMMDTGVRSSLDLIIWGGWWLGVAAMLAVGLL